MTTSAPILNLKVAYTTDIITDAQGNAHKQLGGFTTTDGVTRNMDDVWFSACNDMYWRCAE